MKTSTVLSQTPVVGYGSPYLIDPQAAGRLYISGVSLQAFEENDGATNTTLVRYEGHAGFHVERLDAILRVTAGSVTNVEGAGRPAPFDPHHLDLRSREFTEVRPVEREHEPVAHAGHWPVPTHPSRRGGLWCVRRQTGHRIIPGRR